MRLKQLLNSNVKIAAKNGRTFTGRVSEYFYPDENENGKESIVVDTNVGPSIELYEKDIRSVELIR